MDKFPHIQIWQIGVPSKTATELSRYCTVVKAFYGFLWPSQIPSQEVWQDKIVVTLWYDKGIRCFTGVAKDNDSGFDFTAKSSHWDWAYCVAKWIWSMLASDSFMVTDDHLITKTVQDAFVSVIARNNNDNERNRPVSIDDLDRVTHYHWSGWDQQCSWFLR